MKKIQGLGRVLTKSEQRKIVGGLYPPEGGGGTCTSTCWCEPTGGDECGHTTVSDCTGSNVSDCKSVSGCSNVPKATCSCGS